MSKVLKIVKAGSRGGRRRLARLMDRSRLVLDARTRRQTRRIVRSIRRSGDRALLEAVRSLDRFAVESAAQLALAPLAADEGWSNLPPGFAQALERAMTAVRDFHRPQVRSGYRQELDGIELEERRLPLRRVGVYVPGGRAGYPSTAVMAVIPAQLAGVEEIAVATPPRAYREMPALRYALHCLGVSEVWGMGGAQAVAAFAYGTATVRRVDKIVGPGNSWVTAAKALVAGEVGIDGLAGPTEVVIVADPGSDPQLLAADLLAQAEHDPRAAAVLVTRERRLAKQVRSALEKQLSVLSSAAIAREALSRFGCALLVESNEEAAAVVEALAPEHLQLVGEAAESLAGGIRNAGAIFLGASTPEVFGDYLAGPSHVLPTCGSARFASALGVEDFVRRSHVVRFDARAASLAAAEAALMATAEGLPAHAASAARRSR